MKKYVELLNHLLDTYNDKENYDYTAYNELKKELKALEIITRYFNGVEILTYAMLKEEWNFIKEVLK